MRFKGTTLGIRKNKQRFLAFFLFILMFAGAIIPTASAYAAEVDRTRDIGEITDFNKKMEQNYPGPLPAATAKESGLELTTNPKPKGVSEEVRRQAPKMLNILPGEQPAAGLAANPKHLSEDTAKRTKDSKTYKNDNGTTSTQYFVDETAYQEDGELKDIKPIVAEDSEYNERRKVPESLWERLAPGSSQPMGFKGNQGLLKVGFQTFQGVDGVQVRQGDDVVTMRPENTGEMFIRPEVERQDGIDRITYRNVWEGVDLVYEYRGDHVKEFIVLNQKPAQTSFNFKISGGITLEEHKELPGVIAVVKNGKPLFMLPELSISLEGKGPVGDSGLRYEINGDVVSVVLDQTWLDKQEQKHYPLVIDPQISPHYSKDEISNNKQNYVAYRSDSINCPSSSCWMNVGEQQDNGPKYWQTAMHIPLDTIVGKDLQGAALHMGMATGPGWYGTYDQHRYWVTYATCLGYGCITSSAPWMQIQIDQWGSADITQLVQWLKDNGVAGGGWLMIHGADKPYKALDSYWTSVEMWYNTPPPVPAKFSPQSNEIKTTAMPRLEVLPVTDGDGDAVKYYFTVSNGSGVIASSGLLNTPRWVIPEDILEDGGTYKWAAASVDTSNRFSWTASTSFTVDLRSGKDKSQTYDSAGPMSVNLADGNAYAAASSHSISALGGSIGIGLDYNTPSKSNKGITASYYDGMSGQNKVLTRTDPNIDFEWSDSSPKPGTVPEDNFRVNWEGYFVAPQTGTYTFGAELDDRIAFAIDSDLNGQNEQIFDFNGCCNGLHWATQTVNLTAGQVYPINAWLYEFTNNATARLWVKTPDNVQQIVPQDWLRTKVKELNDTRGMLAKFYKDNNGSHQFVAGQEPFLVQRYGEAQANWGMASPMPFDPGNDFADGFLVRFSGYLTVPISGNYSFGSLGDDGQRIFVNGTSVREDWTNHGPTEIWSNNIYLTAGQVVPVVLEYYEHTGHAQVDLRWNGPAGVGVIGPEYMSTSYRVLPAGWNLGVDPDGEVPYERLKVLGNSNVNLIDGDGTTHTYTWTGSGFKPPVNEEGMLLRNQDGTYTLNDTDGRAYVFRADGTLVSVTSPVDDRKPAALKYEYQDYAGVPRLKKVIDGVTADRYGEVFYGGENQCTTPSGFDAAPAGFVCAFKTSDNQVSNFYYKIGKLSRIELPGNVLTDVEYDSLGRVISVRNAVANDAIAAGVRADDSSVLTEAAYDTIGRLSSVKLPAPSAGASREEHTFAYGFGNSKRHITGAPEPNGYQQYLEYDGLQRTTKVCNIAALCGTTEWHGTKDLVLSSTDASGLKSTILYDDEDRPIHSYGPAPAAWFAVDRTPQTAYAALVPHTESKYDENIVGPAVAYHHYRANADPASAKGGSIFGAPKFHSTGLVNNYTGNTNPGIVEAAWTADPVAPEAGINGWAVSQSGKLRLPASGTYRVRVQHTEGVRLWLNDVVAVENWNDGPFRTSSEHSFTYTAGQEPIRFKLDQYTKYGTPTPRLKLEIKQDGGFDWTTNWTNYLKPGYSLTTSTKSYDAVLGNSTVATNYGASPELGQAQSSAIDPTGLNLITTMAYEAPGSGFLRQTSKILPGGGTTAYSYYSDTETRDNPCTPETEAYKQAGFMKFKTEPDPDGTGSQTGRKSEAVYDDAGRTVASRYNSDDWTCTSYDTRGRTIQTVIPAFNGEPGRTINYNYATWGNPLATSVGDGNGTITTTVDLLGRTTEYTDAGWNSTTTTYDNLGRVTARSGPLGNEAFVYDTLNRLTEQNLDSVTYAKPHYDQYSRVDYIEYPAAGTLNAAITARDGLGRMNELTWHFSDGTEVEDRITRSQSGAMLTNTTESGASQLSRSYDYDDARRLTSTTIGTTSFSYDFGALDPSCGSGNNINPNAGKNSNRVNQTINSTTTTYCYDHADRLLTSSNPNFTNVQYDTHGNTTRLGTTSGGATETEFSYDSSDRVRQITQNGGQKAIFYYHDVAGRLKNRNVQHNWQMQSQRHYGYTSSSGSPTIARDNSWTIQEKYLNLPGGVLLTIKPTEPQTNDQKFYSLPNIHSHTFLTANTSGNNTTTGSGPANTLVYDPFGNLLTANTPPNNATSDASYTFAGSRQKLTEDDLVITPTQMGARTYIAQLGRFIQVDPIEGGTLNAYVYALDPINSHDYSGKSAQCILQCTATVGYLQPAATIAQIQPTASGSSIQRTRNRLQARTVKKATQVSTPPKRSLIPLPITLLKGIDMSTIPMSPTARAGMGEGVVSLRGFSWYGAGSSAMDYGNVGKVGGATLGCATGALFTLGVGGAGCLVVGPIGAVTGGVGGAIYGFFAGGLGWSGADSFEGVPDMDVHFK